MCVECDVNMWTGSVLLSTQLSSVKLFGWEFCLCIGTCRDVFPFSLGLLINSGDVPVLIL